MSARSLYILITSWLSQWRGELDSFVFPPRSSLLFIFRFFPGRNVCILLAAFSFFNTVLHLDFSAIHKDIFLTAQTCLHCLSIFGHQTLTHNFTNSTILNRSIWHNHKRCTADFNSILSTWLWYCEIISLQSCQSTHITSHI